jgi:hypothetical protein
VKRTDKQGLKMLTLRKETVRTLALSELEIVAGGVINTGGGGCANTDTEHSKRAANKTTC